MRHRVRVIAELRPFIDAAQSFSGWNFDHLDVTTLEAPFPNGKMTPWDYDALAREHAARAESVVDLGTGGGEIYARIIAGLGARFVAGEEWHVNAPVAAARLWPLGVDVIHASSERTPYRDASFDVILSRHEAIVPEEIVRIMRPGGVFITQQVAREEWLELEEFFPDRAVFPDHLRDYRAAFERAGLRVETDHHTWKVRYGSLGDVVFMLLVSPWEFPGFDPVRDIDRLMALEEAHGGADGIVLTLARYLMVARKP